jgi:hypothetical protein
MEWDLRFFPLELPVDRSSYCGYGRIPTREANMSVTEQPDESEHLSVKEMHDWLSQELEDLDKARELRIKEATGFVEAYMPGGS